MKSAVLLALLAVSGLGTGFAGGATGAAPAYEFVYDDFYRYQDAIARIDEGTAPAEAFARYLHESSPGLSQFADTYAVDVARLVSQWQTHEAYYRSLAGMARHFSEIERRSRLAIKEMASLDPDLVPRPVHLFVAGYRAGGANDNNDAGVQIGLELFGAGNGAPLQSFSATRAPYLTVDEIDDIIVHEMAHIFQEQLQGTETYLSLYLEESKSTLLGLALREGGADFVASVFSGGSMIPAATAYGLKHEAELWPSFAADMFGAETGDWMFAKPVNGEWPQDLGYFFGARIANSYYQRAEDKRAALVDILRISDFAGFLQASGYGKAFNP